MLDSQTRGKKGTIGRENSTGNGTEMRLHVAGAQELGKDMRGEDRKMWWLLNPKMPRYSKAELWGLLHHPGLGVTKWC